MYYPKHLWIILHICCLQHLILAKATKSQSEQSACDLLHKELEILKEHLVGENSQEQSTNVNSGEINDKNSTEVKRFFVRDVDEGGEPKFCIKTADGRISCSDIILPTSCADPSHKACWDNKCHITNPLNSSDTYWVHCNEAIDGGGWTVIQSHPAYFSDSAHDWITYKNGFGDLNDNYWIGLDKLYTLTSELAPAELFIQIVTQYSGDAYVYAKYDNFAIGDEGTNYFLKSLGTYTGNATDILLYHHNMKFSTFDKDNDYDTHRNCAAGRRAGWWYNDCVDSNFNGVSGWIWNTVYDSTDHIVSSQMLIRPRKN